MKTLHFQRTIRASKEQVWNILWDKETYAQWTAVFCANSTYKGDLQEGNPIQFTDEKGNGMKSFVEKLTKYKSVAFTHGNELKEGVETPSSWNGAKEIYSLIENEGSTDLSVSVDVVPSMEDFFTTTFQKSLDIVKDLAENN